MTLRRRHASRGFTLVEMVVAVAILAVALLAITLILIPLNRNVGEEITTNDLDINANRVLTDALDRIRPGRMLASTDLTRRYFAWNSTYVKFAVPVDGTGGGFFVAPITDGAGHRMVMTLGGNHPSALSGVGHGFPYYVPNDTFESFGPTQADEDAMAALPARDYQFYEVLRWQDSGRTFSEAEYDLDVDGDGAKDKTFKLGRIELYFPPATVMSSRLGVTPTHETYPAVTVPLSDDIVLWDDSESGHSLDPIFFFGYTTNAAGRRFDMHGNDIDEAIAASGVNTPVLTETLYMSMTVVGFSENDRAFTTRVRSQVSLRNQSQDWANPTP